MISGNDDAVLEQANNPEKPAGIASRLNREWRVQETGNVGTIELTYELDNITGPLGVGTNNLSLLRLMVDDDGDFSSGATLIAPSSFNGTTNIATFEVNFTSGQYYTLGSTEVAALPVGLISFSAKAIENSIQLNWVTASEGNNSHFEVQRSTNGINFQTIGAVQGNGTSQGSSFYEFIDESPFRGYSYYRLKQVDLNGEFTLSEIKSVYLEFKENRSTYLVYPNPVDKGETIRLRYEIVINKTVKV